MRDATAQAERFLTDHWGSPGTLDVLLRYFYPEPDFIATFPVESRGDPGGEYLQRLPRDRKAWLTWKAKGDEYTEKLLSSNRLTAKEAEILEISLLWRDIRLASNRAAPPSAITSVEDLHIRFEKHLIKYAALGVIDRRIREFSGLLTQQKLEASSEVLKRLHASGSKEVQSAVRGIAAEEHPNILSSGSPVELKFQGLDGVMVDISALRGKVVILDFWATWCGPCVEEMPELKRVYEKYRVHGFEIIGIACDREPRRQVDAFLKRHGYTWPQHFDGKGTNNEIARQFGVSSWPTTFLVGKDGHVIAKDVRGVSLEPAIREALGLDIQ